MKTQMSILVAGIIFLLVGQISAATFPVAKEALVSADGNGNITVTAQGEYGWVLIQFCQDNLRAGCGNNQVIEASSDSNGTMVFQMDPGGVSSGQVAFNFRNAKLEGRPWLAIPDCRVKLSGNLEMGMSYYTSDIPESGGAHFVYNGSGLHAWSPIDLSACNQPVVTAKRSAPAPVVSAPKGLTSGEQGQTVTASPDSQNAQAKQVAAPVTHITGGGKVKNKIVQQSGTIQAKGATVTVKGDAVAKEGTPAVYAPTTNVSLISFGQESAKAVAGPDEKIDCVTIVSGKVEDKCSDVKEAVKLPTPPEKEK